MPQTPTAEEQALLEMINRARTSPQDEAEAILSESTPAIDEAVDYFNVDLSVFREQMADYGAVAPLAWDTTLATTADDHSEAMLRTDVQAHQVSGEESFAERMNSADYNGAARENIFAYGQDLRHVHASFVIDWGNGPDGMQDPAGHRESIMDDRMTEVGISVLDDDGSFPRSDYVTTQDFGEGYGEPARLLGVVIDDGDGDAFYDVGEGLGGVTVTVEGGGQTYSTTTWSSGGYQMALADGTYEVTFSGGGLGGEIVRQVMVSGDNVKVDAMAGAASTPLPTDFADDLTGTMEADTIFLKAGHDTYEGLAGHDTIHGNQGHDTLYGRFGDDSIYGGNGVDTIHAGNGDDIVDGGNGPDTAFLGNGSDLYIDNAQGGALGEDTVFAGTGHDTIQGGNSNDVFHGNEGHDEIHGRFGNDRIYGGNGVDTIYAGNGDDTVDGGNGPDTAFLGNGNDLYIDNAQGGALGEDIVFAGTGHDTIQGGNADDVFHGNQGHDEIHGRFGNDKIYGGNGVDTIHAGNGDDVVDGGNGPDTAFLGNGDDLYIDNAQGGALGEDTVFANAGNDTIQGGNGNDAFHGQNGDDVIFGRFGNDEIYGGSGSDRIDGGWGDDRLTGGSEADLFVFVAQTGTDRVIDFEAGLDGVEMLGVTRGEVTLSGGSEGLMLDWDGGQVIFEGLSQGDLTTDEISFV